MKHCIPRGPLDSSESVKAVAKQKSSLTCNRTRYSFKDGKRAPSPLKMEGSQPSLLTVQSTNTNQKSCTIRIAKYLQCMSLGKTPSAQAERK